MPKLVAEGLTKKEFLRLSSKDTNETGARSTTVKELPKIEDENNQEIKIPPRQAVPFIKLFRFASNYDISLSMAGCLFAVIQGMFMPCFALLMGEMIDAFAEEEEGGSSSGLVDVRRLGAGFVVLGAIAFAAAFFQGGFLQVSAVNQQPKIKQAYLAAILRQDIAFMDNNPVGKIQTRIAEDMDLITDAMGEKLGEAVQTLVTFVAGLAVGFYLSWRLTLLTLGTVPVLVLTMAYLMKMIITVQARMNKIQANAASLMQEATSAIRTVCSLTSQGSLVELFHSEATQIYKEQTEFHKTLGISLAAFFTCTYLSYALALWYGSTRVQSGELSGGKVISVFWAILIGGMGLATTATALATIGKGREAAYNIFEVIDMVPTINSASDEGLKPNSCEGCFELRDVHFTYPTRPDLPIFKGYNLTVNAGETVALVGESGGGKSTVISLLERFYDPSQGQVLLDGIDIRQLNVQWLRSQMGLVSQEPILFATTIMENIRHGKRHATDEEVYEAARMANADSFIRGFTDGYNTEVGERGIQLSGGQKQRIAIARAIIRDPRILLLDEATSALDSESEVVVQEALDSLLKLKRRTTIVVAHRLSTIRNADCIAVVYDGCIVEKGTHDELSQIEGGNYSRLVKLQSKAVQEDKS